MSQHEDPQFPSQVSPASTRLLRQTGEQSSSFRLLHPGAQQPSPLVQLVTSTLVQIASQLLAEPFKTSLVQLFASPHKVGQFPSQLSFASVTLFPQIDPQSPSLLLLQPVGQHPSPCAQVVISLKTQATSQVEALPVRESAVQTTPSSQDVGQFPSQISPASTRLFEHRGAQSLSLRLLHPGAQQESPELHAIMSG